MIIPMVLSNAEGGSKFECIMAARMIADIVTGIIHNYILFGFLRK